MSVSGAVDLRPNWGLHSGRAARVVMKTFYTPNGVTVCSSHEFKSQSTLPVSFQDMQWWARGHIGAQEPPVLPDLTERSASPSTW